MIANMLTCFDRTLHFFLGKFVDGSWDDPFLMTRAQSFWVKDSWSSYLGWGALQSLG